jgi:hypothetical protein
VCTHHYLLEWCFTLTSTLNIDPTEEQQYTCFEKQLFYMRVQLAASVIGCRGRLRALPALVTLLPTCDAAALDALTACKVHQVEAALHTHRAHLASADSHHHSSSADIATAERGTTRQHTLLCEAERHSSETCDGEGV